jgi:hypothetical protein
LPVFDGSDRHWKESWQCIEEAKLQQVGQPILQTIVSLAAVQANTAAGQPIFSEGNIDNNDSNDDDGDDGDDGNFAVYDNEDLKDDYGEPNGKEEDEVLVD